MQIGFDSQLNLCTVQNKSNLILENKLLYPRKQSLQGYVLSVHLSLTMNSKNDTIQRAYINRIIMGINLSKSILFVQFAFFLSSLQYEIIFL